MSMTISTNVNIFLRNGLMVLGSLVFMLGMSWRLTAVTLIVIPPIAFFTKMYSAYYDVNFCLALFDLPDHSI